MAMRCAADGSFFDDSGTCALGHADPDALRDDVARLTGEGSCKNPICKVCCKPLESHTDAELAACHPALPDPGATAAN